MSHGHNVRIDGKRYISPTYHSFNAMKKRCNWKGAWNYANYGGRGITVCSEWKKFENFLIDMGPRPEGMTLDRIDPNGDYNKENCKWSTHKEQRANQRPRKVSA